MSNKGMIAINSICFILTTALCSIQAINITVVDSKNDEGIDNSSCLIGEIQCSTLDFVFSNLSDCHGDSVSVSLFDGNYSFTLNSTVTSSLFKNCPVINITGVSTDNTSITCGIDAGFAFQNILEVNIAKITFTSCGSLRNSTSVNVTINSPNTTFLLSTALYFVYCKDVYIVNVIVQNSNSTGVVMYNTYGNLLINGSTFMGNSNQKNSLPSNGGLYIEFVYCDPGKVDDNCIQQKNYNASFWLDSNRFLFNYASVKLENMLFYVPHKAKYYSFGRGGGLSIVFRGNASNNTVHINNCAFYGNSASRGGGLLVEFEDFAKNNKMFISNTHFSENRVMLDNENGYGTAGGGVRAGFVIYEQKSVEFNTMLFENCLFAGNTALWGGGFGMYAPYEPNVVNATNSLSFKNCSWNANKGLLGSAIDLDFWRIHTAGAKMQVKFSTCKFHDNKDREQNMLDMNIWYDFNSFGTGALYANGIPIVFEESVEFSNNNGSALAIYDTTARFSDNCNATFINNSAWMGGAVVMLGASQMWINSYTVFLFQSNEAKLRGGAIYVLQTSRHDLLTGGNCFLQYSNHSVSSPNDWITNFTFINNVAPTGTSIFATTILPCAWGTSFKDLNSTVLKVFNWTNFSYQPLNNNTIATEISKISLEENTSTPVEIVPGKYSELPITTVDDRGNYVSRSLWLVSNDKNVQVSWGITDNATVNLQGMPNSEATIDVVTDSCRVISAKLSVKLVNCPPGYYLNSYKNNTCQCSYLNSTQRLEGILSCDIETFTAKYKRGYWAGYHVSSQHPTPTDINLITGQCPRHYCHATEQETPLPNTNNVTLLNELICSPVNRNGTLCGMCSDGYSVAINSIFFDCINCLDWLSQHGWLSYILTEYVPSTLLFCVVLFFDINLHSGTISLVVLYFQIFDLLNIYSDGEVDQPLHSDWILTGIRFFYNIWNLEFFGYLLPPYCISKHFNTMDIFMIEYFSGFYPFLLFVLFIALTNLVYVRLCGMEKVARYIRNQCTWCKFRVNQKGSTVNGLATLWTLVFTKFAVLSGLILSQETLHGSEHSNLKVKVAWLNGNLLYGGREHLPYMIPAVVILLFFVVIPAVSLLCYPLIPQIVGIIEEKRGVSFNQYRYYRIVSKPLQKPFTKLKPLIDCFQSSCKGRCEFYAGLLFIYRISIVFVFSFTIQADIIFYNTVISLLLIIITAIVQPYKKSQENIVTILCISNIIFINFLSFYNLYYTETQSNCDLQPWLWLQLIMVLLPLVFFVVFMVRRSCYKLIVCWNKENHYNHVPQNDSDELNFPVRAFEDSTQSHTDKSNGNDHPASSHLHSATGSSIQNHECLSEDNDKSSENPVRNYGSCGNQHNTSDN